MVSEFSHTSMFINYYINFRNLKDDLLTIALNKQDSEYFWCLGVLMKNDKYDPVLYFQSSFIEQLLSFT